MVAHENERKYLVQSAGWRKQARRGEHYRQGYLSTDPERSVRVRAGSDTAVIAIKGAAGNGNGLHRAEFEYPIPLEDANQLLDHVCLHPLIEKTRFRLPQKNSEWRGRSDVPETKYHWKSGEDPSEGLRRIVSEQLQCAIWHLSENAKALGEAVHEARKSLKKTRSALRLMRGSLGAECDKENEVLRDAGRKLSPVRDAQALIEMFDELNDQSLISAREGLVARKKNLTRDFQRRRTRSNVVQTLRDATDRVRKWNFADAGLQVLAKGFATTIRRNRKAFVAARDDSSPDGFHEWRKRAKDLSYHVGLVVKARPAVLDAYEAAAKELESKLGDDHNLVVLRNTILEKPDDFGTQEDVKAFLDVVDKRQRELRSESRSLAERLYGDKPKLWRRRIERCWSAWKAEP